MFSYEIRIDLADRSEIVTLEAATIQEAVQRASVIWVNPERVRVLTTIDRKPQACLAW